MTSKELKTQVVYPVLVAVILGALTLAGSVYVTQQLILAAIDDLQEQVDRIYSLTDDHVREGH